jgi:hypothetical protein
MKLFPSRKAEEARSVSNERPLRETEKPQLLRALLQTRNYSALEPHPMCAARALGSVAGAASHRSESSPEAS